MNGLKELTATIVRITSISFTIISLMRTNVQKDKFMNTRIEKYKEKREQIYAENKKYRKLRYIIYRWVHSPSLKKYKHMKRR